MRPALLFLLSPLVWATTDPPVAPAEGDSAADPLAVLPGALVDEGAIPSEILDAVRASRGLPIGERMAAISEPMLDVPYLVDAIGEGVAPDLDPPARYDAYDCLTFVEEVMALALSGDPLHAAEIRSDLRYRGQERSYAERNHFMLQEWVPNAIARGYLRDITGELGETHLLTKEVGPDTWSRWSKRRHFSLLPNPRLPVGTFTLPVLSLSAAYEAIGRIPDGALLLTVRQSSERIPIVVTHLGFKVPSADVGKMRHATKMGEEPRVRDDRLYWYLEHLRWYHWWPVEGITVLMPQDPGPRVGRLATPVPLAPARLH